MVDEFLSSRWREIPGMLRRLALRHQRRMLNALVAAGLVFVGAVLAIAGIVAIKMTSPPRLSVAEPVAPEEFRPRAESQIPDGPQGDAIRRGRTLFTDTRVAAARYAGSDLSCSSCHLDAGRQADASPMWAAWVAYPRYRTKDRAISTMEDRIRGCFTYSMNAQYSPAGAAPPPGSDIYRDLQTYFYWLAEGAPTGEKMAGSGFPTPPLPPSGYDHARGASVYDRNCSACHGADGAGRRNPDNSVAIPPLWGDRSFNWGAGMARIDLAAGFIKANMPLGQGNTLSDQEAWDVAAFMDSHERPKDPRQTGSVGQNAQLNFAGQHSYYGKVVDGRTLGAGTSRQ